MLNDFQRHTQLEAFGGRDIERVVTSVDTRKFEKWGWGTRQCIGPLLLYHKCAYAFYPGKATYCNKF